MFLSTPAAEPHALREQHAPPRFRIEPGARAEALERRRLAADLRRAVAAGEFVLHYQPRLSLATGATLGAEALLRWSHRRRGLLPPASFLPAAERSGLTSAIGGDVLRRACAEAVAWPDGPDTAPSVSVNIAARQVRDGVLLRQVTAALEGSGLPPHRLELELTETVALDGDAEMLLSLAALRDVGVGLSLDDFGTGYASLALLKRLPLTALKLDRSLVRELPASAEDAAIARAVIATGHALGLSIVAEGIETEAQRAFLAALGCDSGQGWLFSRALAPDALQAFLT